MLARATFFQLMTDVLKLVTVCNQFPSVSFLLYLD